MNIPDKAVEAAAKAEYELTDETWSDLYESDQDNWKRYARAALEAAAPIIAAQALRDAADLFAEEEGVKVLAFAGDFTEVHAVMAVETWLRERSAIELEDGK